MRRNIFLSTLVLALISMSSFKKSPEEGMYPISLLGTLDFEKIGMDLKASDIFNEQGTGLVNAVVNINGCTGSFISKDGLILTNHHCVFSSLRSYTNETTNYMRDGFLAGDKVKELPMPDYKVRIMKSFKDVSTMVLATAGKISDPVERDRAIRKMIKEIEEKEQKEFPNYEIEISEMLAGSSYILFRYDYLKDVRLVYVPPRYIGEFGGETDNWMWPRHSGDFSFVRAYAGKDGKPAEYSKDNVPYSPVRYLETDFDGVKESDLVFILGYPGRTYRHYPAEFIKYMDEVQMPYIADLWGWQIDRMEELSKKNDRLEIKYATRIKRLANTMKNYKGKMQSLRRINLYEKKKGEEELVKQLLASSSKKETQDFTKTLDELNRLYGEMIAIGPRRFWYSQLTSASRYAEIAHYATAYASLPEAKRTDETLNKYLKAIRTDYKRFDVLTDSLFAAKMLRDGLNYGIPGLSKHLNSNDDVTDFIKTVYSKGKIADSSYIIKILKTNPDKLKKSKDPMIRLQFDLIAGRNTVGQKMTELDAQIRSQLPKYVDFKMKAKEGQFIPDANSTLRFTYGSIKGYSPSDGVQTRPVTTVKGILEKSSMEGEYELGDGLKNAIVNNNRGKFYRSELGSVPVNILYNTDTSGGNSGSPILNKSGKLVGLNFDRNFEACVNDFAWDDSYSRSIGVDIRYILWVTQHVGQADYLVKEIRNQ